MLKNMYIHQMEARSSKILIQPFFPRVTIPSQPFSQGAVPFAAIFSQGLLFPRSHFHRVLFPLQLFFPRVTVPSQPFSQGAVPFAAIFSQGSLFPRSHFHRVLFPCIINTRYSQSNTMGIGWHGRIRTNLQISRQGGDYYRMIHLEHQKTRYGIWGTFPFHL